MNSESQNKCCPVPDFRQNIGDCWKRIGVFGDHSCPELETAGHCFNCFVYSSAGRVLLERKPTPGALRESQRLLAQPPEPETGPLISWIVFRLGGEYLALPCRRYAGISEMKSIHSIPYRRDGVLLGLVNVLGELLPCISLAVVLGIEATVSDKPSSGKKNFPRLMVLQDDEKTWVFPVDEVAGIARRPLEDLAPAPSTVAKKTPAFTRGILACREYDVVVLQDDLLFRHVAGYFA